MKNFLTTLLLWALLIIACGLFYAALTIPFASAFANVTMAISAVFILVQCLGIIDKRHGFGQGDSNNDTEKKS